MNQSSPEKQAAAYDFAKYLDEAKVQSEWAAATGYIPVDKSAATISPLAEKWAQDPDYKVALRPAHDRCRERRHRRTGDRPVRRPR